MARISAFRTWLGNKRTGFHNRYGGSNAAVRTCGAYKIGISFSEKTGYECCFFLSDRQVATIYVRPAAVQTTAIDSSRAYDEIASAAVSFAVDDQKVDDGQLEFADSGYMIRRWRAGE